MELSAGDEVLLSAKGVVLVGSDEWALTIRGEGEKEFTYYPQEPERPLKIEVTRQAYVDRSVYIDDMSNLWKYADSTPGWFKLEADGDWSDITYALDAPAGELIELIKKHGEVELYLEH